MSLEPLLKPNAHGETWGSPHGRLCVSEKKDGALSCKVGPTPSQPPSLSQGADGAELSVRGWCLLRQVTADSIAKRDPSNHSQGPASRRRPNQPASTRLSFHDEPTQGAAMDLMLKGKSSFGLTYREQHGRAGRSLGRTLGWLAGQGRHRPNVFRLIPSKASTANRRGIVPILRHALTGESWPPRNDTPILMWASLFQGQSGRGDKVDAASCPSISTRRVVSCFSHSTPLNLGLVSISGGLWKLVLRGFSPCSCLVSLLRCILINLPLPPAGSGFFPALTAHPDHAPTNHQAHAGTFAQSTGLLADHQDAEPQYQRAEPRLVGSRYVFPIHVLGPRRGICQGEV